MESKTSRRRIESIDLFKGVLVLLMIVYHTTLLYVTKGDDERADLIRMELAFLHSAFLFVSGFLCGFHYAPKRDQGVAVARRVLTRGLRLFCVFALCNVVAYATTSAYEVSSFLKSFDSWESISRSYILSVSGKLFAFEILAYIAVYLCIASITLAPIGLAVATFALIIAAATIPSPMLTFLQIGFLGQVLGTLVYYRNFSVHDTLNRKETFVCLAILALVARFIIPTEHWHSIPLIGPLWLVADTLLWWWCAAAANKALPRAATRSIVFLGKYTLMAYLLQMPIIRIASAISFNSSIDSRALYFATVIFTCVASLLFLHLLERARRRWVIADDAYRFAFA